MKIGPSRNSNSAAVGSPHRGADDVRGQQVGRELHAGESGVHGRGRAARHQRLGRAGNALEEHVTADQDGEQQAVDGLLLSDDGAADGVVERAAQLGGRGHRAHCAVATRAGCAQRRSRSSTSRASDSSAAASGRLAARARARLQHRGHVSGELRAGAAHRLDEHGVAGRPGRRERRHAGAGGAARRRSGWPPPRGRGCARTGRPWRRCTRQWWGRARRREPPAAGRARRPLMPRKATTAATPSSRASPSGLSNTAAAPSAVDGGLAVVVLVEADAAATGALQHREHQRRRVGVAQAVVAERQRRRQHVRATAPRRRLLGDGGQRAGLGQQRGEERSWVDRAAGRHGHVVHAAAGVDRLGRDGVAGCTRSVAEADPQPHQQRGGVRLAGRREREDEVGPTGHRLDHALGVGVADRRPRVDDEQHVGSRRVELAADAVDAEAELVEPVVQGQGAALAGDARGWVVVLIGCGRAGDEQDQGEDDGDGDDGVAGHRTSHRAAAPASRASRRTAPQRSSARTQSSPRHDGARVPGALEERLRQRRARRARRRPRRCVRAARAWSRRRRCARCPGPPPPAARSGRRGAPPRGSRPSAAARSAARHSASGSSPAVAGSSTAGVAQRRRAAPAPPRQRQGDAEHGGGEQAAPDGPERARTAAQQVADGVEDRWPAGLLPASRRGGGSRATRRRRAARCARPSAFSSHTEPRRVGESRAHRREAQLRVGRRQAGCRRGRRRTGCSATQLARSAATSALTVRCAAGDVRRHLLQRARPPTPGPPGSRARGRPRRARWGTVLTATAGASTAAAADASELAASDGGREHLDVEGLSADAQVVVEEHHDDEADRLDEHGHDQRRRAG